MNEWLVEQVLAQGLLSLQQIQALARADAAQSRSWHERLARAGAVDEARLVAMYQAAGVRDVTAQLRLTAPGPAALGALPAEDAIQARALPLSVTPSTLELAMLDPADPLTLDRLAKRVGLAITPRIARASVLLERLAEAYRCPPFAVDPALAAVVRQHAAPSPANAASEGLRRPSSKTVRGMPATARAAAPVRTPPPVRRQSPGPGHGRALPRWPRAAETAFVPSDKMAAAPAHVMPPPLRTPTPPDRGGPITNAVARRVRALRVLRDLVPPMRAAVLFTVRDGIAMGWCATGAPVDDVGHILVPLGDRSAFGRAHRWRLTAAVLPANAGPSAQMLWRTLGLGAPSALAVLPVMATSAAAAAPKAACPAALLYVDREAGPFDAVLLQRAKAATTALAEQIERAIADERQHASSPQWPAGTDADD